LFCRYRVSLEGELEIPDGVVSIGNEAFFR
jgi:hypothetical protein